MLILAARVYHDFEDVWAPGVFVLKLTPEVLSTLKADVRCLEYYDDVRRFASIAFDTPDGYWIDDEDLERLVEDKEAVVVDWFGSIPEDTVPMDRQHHELRLHSGGEFEIIFHARGANSGHCFSTEPIFYSWLVREIERVNHQPVYQLEPEF